LARSDPIPFGKEHLGAEFEAERQGADSAGRIRLVVGVWRIDWAAPGRREADAQDQEALGDERVLQTLLDDVAALGMIQAQLVELRRQGA
jgi:hypothetical protein